MPPWVLRFLNVAMPPDIAIRALMWAGLLMGDFKTNNLKSCRFNKLFCLKENSTQSGLGTCFFATVAVWVCCQALALVCLGMSVGCQWVERVRFCVT
jgi:hypothetical protein